MDDVSGPKPGTVTVDECGINDGKNIAVRISDDEPTLSDDRADEVPTVGNSDVIGTLMKVDRDVGNACQETVEPTSGQALTNIVMTVEYDGGEYNGFVGPNHFFNEEIRCMVGNDEGVQTSPKRGAAFKSVSNELLRAIAVIHGYIPGKRKRKKQHSQHHVDLGEVEEEEGDDTATLPTERRFSLIACSRTDRGVHANETACQYLSFDREPPFDGDLDAIMDKVNRILPEDIRVTSMITAPSHDFNVRFENLGKCYTYKVDLSECPNIFERKYYWQVIADNQFRNTLLKKYNDVRKDFSFERMRAAADAIQGTHNFEVSVYCASALSFQGFRKKSRGNEKAVAKNPICTIDRIDIERHDTQPGQKKFHVVINGDRFLYKMVRGIVSHIVLVGYGILKVEDIEQILEKGEAIPEIQYAPSTGLYLTKVKFDGEVERALEDSRLRRQQRLRDLLKPPAKAVH
ncbi:tRNA-pseudouridine synthase I [Babesia caballi]|uniref:tRNA pseudouridine synthase n=1 Tax=Babesia caballi TaxID=5871 RepID=A0AAV4LWC7_BABCB|nr:tRNA-pseudouridine synthase I [Babesia caballi]